MRLAQADFDAYPEKRGKVYNVCEVSADDYPGKKSSFFIEGVEYFVWKTKDQRFFLHKDGTHYGKVLKIEKGNLLDEKGNPIGLSDLKPFHVVDTPFYVKENGEETTFLRKEELKTGLKNSERKGETWKRFSKTEDVSEITTIFSFSELGHYAPGSNLLLKNEVEAIEALNDNRISTIVSARQFSWTKNKKEINKLIEILDDVQAKLKLSERTHLESILKEEGFLVTKTTTIDVLDSVIRDVDSEAEEPDANGPLRFSITGEYENSMIYAVYAKTKPRKLTPYNPDAETLSIQFKIPYTGSAEKRLAKFAEIIIAAAKSAGLELKRI